MITEIEAEAVALRILRPPACLIISRALLDNPSITYTCLESLRAFSWSKSVLKKEMSGEGKSKLVESPTLVSFHSLFSG